MSDWKIQAVKADPENIGTHELLLSFIECDRAWRRLSKPARAAVEAAYPDAWIVCHPLTRKALQRHGFIIRSGPTGWKLTPAAREVVRWIVRL